jgi:hypothetical protein
VYTHQVSGHLAPLQQHYSTQTLELPHVCKPALPLPMNPTPSTIPPPTHTHSLTHRYRLR